jgi:hypothetical protein
MMQVRRPARKALEVLKLYVGVKLFITLLKKYFISTLARAACGNNSGVGVATGF